MDRDLSTLEEIRSSGTLLVVPWHDAAVDALGHDPRSYYVERFWLPVLGPSTVFLLRLLTTALDGSPEGSELDLAETARRLGLGERSGRHAPVVRTLGRCVDFEMARPAGLGTLAVRRRLPPLARRHQARLTASLLDEHDRWAAASSPHPAAGCPDPAAPAAVLSLLRERGRQLALSLLQLGEDRAAAEHQLVRWRYHPALAGECAAWAAAVHAARSGHGAADVAPATASNIGAP
jgi:hypothetical protein